MFGALGFLDDGTTPYHINDGATVDVYPTGSAPIGTSGSWWEDALNAVVLTNQNYQAGQAAQAAAQRNVIIPSPVSVGVGGNAAVNQGAVAGAAAGSAVNGFANFVKNNWVLVGAGGIAAFLILTKKG